MSEGVAHQGQVRSELQEAGGPVRKGLQRISHAINDNSDRMAGFVGSLDPGEVNERAHWHPVDGPIPYSLSRLPARLLIELSNDNGAPEIPTSPKAVQEAMDAFWPGNRQFHQEVLGRHEYATDPVTGRAGWSHVLRKLIGSEVDLGDWQSYLSAHNEQLERGRYTLDFMAARMARNDVTAFNERHGIYDAFAGRFKSFMAAETSATGADIVSWVQLPIGAYGPELTTRLIRTGGWLVNAAEQDTDLHEDMASQVRQNPLLFAQRTFRGLDLNAPSLEFSPVVGLQEGDISRLHIASVLSGDLVERYEDDPDGLMRRIFCEDDLIDAMVMISRLGLAASVSFYGVKLDHPVLSKPNGKLYINPAIKDTLQELQEIGEKIAHDELKEYEQKVQAWEAADKQGPEPEPPARTGLACPFTGLMYASLAGEDGDRRGAITRRGEPTYAIYERINPLSNGQIPQGLPRDAPRFI